jgi:hypothetical protein
MIIQKEVSVPANTTIENLFAGSAFEFPRSNVLVSLGVVQSATGCFVTIQAGGEIVLEESPPAISTDYPLIPDEFYYNFAAVAGDRLVTRVRNSTAGALTVRAVAMITQVR